MTGDADARERIDRFLARVAEPLVRSMREAGMIRPDSLGLGLETDYRGALLDGAVARQRPAFSGGAASQRRGLWENTAVLELRIEAQRMAATLGAAGARRFPRDGSPGRLGRGPAAR